MDRFHAHIRILLWLGLTLPGAAASRVPWTSSHVTGSPYPPSPYTVERLLGDLSFEHPVDLAFLPGSRMLVVAEQGGKIFAFDTSANANGRPPQLVQDLSRHHRPFDDILGFTFHPGFATNHYVFVNYNEPGGRTNGAFVSRFTFSSLNPPRLDPASERVIIRWLSGGHNGCTLAFGPDGFLYISTGDAANPDPPDFPFRTGQDISDLLASVLRIDVDHADGTNAYASPADNPFIRTPGARPEVWAYGFRNPFRMSFDDATGDLWVGDVGWEQYEMIYRVRRGGNYGWSIVEGPNTAVRTDVRPGPTPILPPMVALTHADAASITGGHVYHGRRLPQLQGAYLYGDWETGKFWALRQRGDQLLSNDELCDTSLKPVSFVLDPDGELIILDYNGGFYRLIPNNAAPANQSFPRRLSETGIYASLQPFQPAPGTVPYHINAPMWNDHASADWLLAVPGDGAIATAGGVGNITGPTWYFPTNSVLARTLRLAMRSGDRRSERRIETQVLHWDGQAWNPYTYRWNTAQSDASLVGADGTNDLFVVLDPDAPGGQRHTPWRFASRAECLRCHNAWAGDAITLNWLQLGRGPGSGSRFNAELGSPAPGTNSEFARLQSSGVLRIVSPPPAELRAMVDPHELSAPLPERARSWLHANCAACHRFGAGGAAALHLNFDKAPAEWRAIDEKPTRGDFGLAGARIIASGDPYRSTLFYRISTEGAGRMPHLGSRLVDPFGVQLVRDWIRGLPPKGNPSASTATAAETPGGTGKLAGEIAGRLAKSSPENLAKNNNSFADVLASMNGSLALLDLITASNWPAATIAEVGRASQTHTNAMVRDLFQRLLPPDQRRVTLGTAIRPANVLALAGDAARGRQLFHGQAQCARCHLCEKAGRLFGPDLSAIGRKYPRAQLLDQILAPSKTVAPEYTTTVITLQDDTELTGFVLRRTPDELEFRDEMAADRKLKVSEIKETRVSTLSAMPEGLLAPLTAQEAADLLEYLCVMR
jgi:putative heme-binding domain-containing protein